MPEYVIYCDGSLRPPGLGAWAAIVLHNDAEIATMRDYAFDTTISRMELTAALSGLKSIVVPSDVTIVSDSQYTVNSIQTWIRQWMRHNWQRQDGTPVKNIDLMQSLADEIQRHTSVTAKWVRGHSGDVYNEKCDTLAQDLTRRMVSGELRPGMAVADLPEAPVTPMPSFQIVLLPDRKTKYNHRASVRGATGKSTRKASRNKFHPRKKKAR